MSIRVIHPIINTTAEPFISGYDLVAWLQDVESDLVKAQKTVNLSSAVTEDTISTFKIIRESIESFCSDEA